LTVADEIAVSGVRPYRVHAMATTSGIDRTGEVPGLKSVAMATGAPPWRSSAAGGGEARRKKVEAGSRTDAVIPAPSACTVPLGR